MNRKLLFTFFYVFVLTVFSFAQNAIVTENANAGNPISEWGVPDFRDNRIAGYATKMSLNSGQTVRFKINVQSGANYTIKIYRIGYYGGNGARLMQNLGTFSGTVQPNGISNSTTGLLDCSNWSESASWAIPSNAVSGLYIAKIERTGGGSNHIVFIVRNDASNSDLYLQFPDATWQAYNGYGGNSNYDGSTSWPSGHAVKVSYNRPFFPYNSLFNTEGREADWYMNAEYPMIRWLERNGYDVTYTSCNDVDNNGGRLLNHKVFISIGHDEYWSKGMRDNVEAARNAGVHLAFFTGNEVYWKTRWESNDGTEDRTLVCYKEGTMADGSINERACGSKCDGSTSEWTGLWRMGGNYDAGKPENALVGQISWVEYPSEIQVPAFYKKIRLWRNTTIPNLSSGQTAALGINTLGYEWDYEQSQFLSSYPAGRFTTSSTTISGKTHKLSLYRHSSGALVFGAGTVQWSWGLDGAHFGGSTTTSTEMQQATVNLFADMGNVQPATIQSGLTQVSQSSDFNAPSVSISSPSNGSSFSVGATVNFSGSSTDGGGGVVASVEVSVDGGSTWTPATISAADVSNTWSFAWTAGSNGTYTIRARGVDDSGNIGTSTNITITIGTGGDATPPTVSTVSPTNAATGVSTATTVSAIFTESVNSSTVTGSTFQLRDAGNNLINATVSTSGSQITLTPSAALANSSTYTVTITGGASGVKDLAGNALANNYSWSFTTAANADNIPPTISSVSPVSGAAGINIYTTVTANFSEAINASTVTGSTFQLRDAGSNLVSATVSISSNQITLTPATVLTISTTYTVTIVGGASGVKDLAGNALVNNYSWSFTTGTATSPPPVTIQSSDTKTGTAATAHSLTGVPAGALLVLATTSDAVVSNCSVSSSPSLTWTKRSDAGATSSDNAEIWTALYTAGGSITVTSNWGAVSQASVCYVVLYAEPTLGGASATAVSQSAPSVLLTTTRDNSIIFGCTADFNAVNGTTRTLRDAATERLYFKDGNYTTYHYTKAAVTIGAYTEGVSLPTGQQSSTALLEIRGIAAAADVTPPTVSSVSPVNGATGVIVSTTVIANFSEAVNGSTVTGTTFQLRDAGSNLVSATVSTSSGQITLTPAAALTASTTYTATITGGASGVKDLAGNALVNNYSWSFTTAAIVDNTPPTVSSVTPLNGATGVIVSTTVIANFSEDVNGSTVTGTTFQLRDAGSNLVSATVSTSSGQITLTPAAALTASTTYTVTITGGASGVKDLAGNALVNNYSWSFTTAAIVDNTPPSVSSVSPLNGATGVSTGTNVTATFSEAINGSTATASTFQLRDAGSNLVSATVSTSSGQITLTPAAALTASTTYTVTITGGASGVKDLAGNALVNNYSWSFTTAASGNVGGTTYTLFLSTDAPSVPLAHDGTGIELGMRFRSTQDGFINGIRYYKGSGTTGTHIGNLWNNAGTTLLAQATFTTETSSGWQQVLFSSPVAITAGVTYVASYFSPSGDYSATKPYFTQNIVNGPLTGLADGIDGGNGLYRYTTSSAFPNSTFQSSNYWVDVVFATISDNTAPTVLSVSPVSGATGVSTGTVAIANFSEAINASTVTGTTVQLRDAGNTLIAATVSTSGSQVTLTPSAALTGSAIYTVTITGGASGVKDLAGNALVSNYVWSFTTAAIDNIAPTVFSVSPSSGATGVSISSTVTANFSEAINATTVTTSTFQLRNPANTLIAANISVSGNQIILTASAALTSSTVYTATITGGASGIKDLAGNQLANDYSWSFTTAIAISQPPVAIQSSDTKTGTVATVHSLTGVPAGALLVLATTADVVVSDCIVSSSPSLTWTKRSDAGANNSDNAEIWTAVYTAGGSITVTSNWGGGHSQASVCYIVLNAESTLGGASAIGTLQASPSVTITTTRDNSILFGCTADWNAVNGTTRTLRDAATERLYFKDGNYTTYHYTKAAATIAAYTEGVSLPTGQQSSTALLEIRSAGTLGTRPANPAINTISNITVNSKVYSNSLGQNYPNPFHKVTDIPFTISKAEKVNIVLLDINGRVVKVLVNASKDAGTHSVNFNTGSLTKGIYYYRIQAGDFTAVKKLIIW